MSILDIINQRANSLDVQVAKSKPVSVDELPWIETIRRVNEMPANMGMIEDIVRSKKAVPGAVIDSMYGHCNKDKCTQDAVRIEVSLEKDPFEIQLLLYVCGNHGTKNAMYVAFNSQKNVVYRRKIIVNFEPQL